jgi:plasmid stabilization system protein ParE
MVEIRWVPLAIDDYESIIMYYERRAPIFAQNFATKIIYIIENLTRFPKMGRIVPEFQKERIREIIYRNFRIILG